MINAETGKSFLNDWDFAKLVENPGEATASDRSGTWPYMSATLLMFPLKPNHLFDDLESFLHVLQMLGMRFHLHSHSSTKMVTSGGRSSKVYNAVANAKNTRFATVLRSLCFLAHKWGQNFVGGQEKYLYLSLGEPPVLFSGPSRPSGALPTLVSEWHKLFSQHYGTLERMTWEALWGELHREVPVSQSVRDSVAKCTLSKMTHEDLDGPWRAVLGDEAFLDSSEPKTEDQLETLPLPDGTPFMKVSTGSKKRSVISMSSSG
ncbi:uncharacterized protein PHACADRAFT_189911 [Phanerochaete carnosa HHB-10118-sp]|uniref:Fungal-type protein kinase domain-containing protein n=1 Tax=Phanerochaete carnosa (strain HHB-10118-sp) TaxID=650164 RepID=K5WA12_PHACS|nr:uncharacterized protein PHACADRAFT_189911 [Phanerochaete carnosa HHB-10118-sp]EKM60783.1 hypothetical protein PHACADRAFT_189911 [Phanerochaete carnosa HHB-10118-sp]